MKKPALNKLLITTAFILSIILPGGASYALAQDADNEEMAETTPAPEAALIDANPALWVVKDADTTIYLFGTVHVLKPEINWFDDAVKTAFDTSDTLILELVQPPQAEMQASFMALAIDQSGKTLRQKMNDDDRMIYEGAMAKLGVPAATFDPFEPWAAAITMQVMAITREGFNPASGVEAVLTSAAKASSKAVNGLETVEYQLGIFDSLSQEQQMKLLLEGAGALDKVKHNLNALIDAWGAAEPQKLAELMNEGLQDPEIFSKLLTRRNANWAKWIKNRLETPGKIFIAVGAGHLSGTTSVPSLLAAYGLRADRVEY